MHPVQAQQIWNYANQRRRSLSVQAKMQENYERTWHCTQFCRNLCSKITNLSNWINHNFVAQTERTVRLLSLTLSLPPVRNSKWGGVCSTYVWLDHVQRQQSPSCYSNNRRQRLWDPSSIAATDVMLLVAFTHWRGQAKFGVTLMCHLDLDTSFMMSECVHVCGCVQFCDWCFAKAKKCGSSLHNPTRAGFLGRHGAAGAGALWLVNGLV